MKTEEVSKDTVIQVDSTTKFSDEEKSTVIECECGTHMLKVSSIVDYYENKKMNTLQYHQDFYFAMFNYGSGGDKDSIWRRIRIALKYLKTGKMFSDQICLTPEEATKLSSFIEENVVNSKKIL